MRRAAGVMVLGVLLWMSWRLWLSLAPDARWLVVGVSVGLLFCVPTVTLALAGQRRQVRRAHYYDGDEQEDQQCLERPTVTVLAEPARENRMLEVK